MGGRLDTTNIIQPLACNYANRNGAFVKDFRATHWQKSRLKKRGLSKKACRLFLFEQDEEALAVIKKTVKGKNAMLFLCQSLLRLSKMSFPLTA